MRRAPLFILGGFVAAGIGLAACGGGSTSAVPSSSVAKSSIRFDVTSPSPTPTITPTPTPKPTPSHRTVSVGFGQVNGLDDQFSNPYDTNQPHDGDSASGGHGPLGSNVDGITCDASMANSGYHIHFFLGLYVNGAQIAIPDGVGMSEPSGEGTFNGFPDQTEYVYPSPGSTSGCYYRMHTHDPSGAIHVELPVTTAKTATLTQLGQFLDIWGQSIDALHFGPYSGPVTVYTSGQVYRGNSNNGYVYSYYFSQYTGDPRQIPIYSHECIWIMVGTGNPTLSQLPNVDFYEEY